MLCYMLIFYKYKQNVGVGKPHHLLLKAFYLHRTVPKWFKQTALLTDIAILRVNFICGIYLYEPNPLNDEQ